ncbi:MAG: aromatic ring-hydroxylating dioxygenase subunit alpha [Acidimicrobiales bacterium]|nr:aromatic ring-hydroxylating dioxygenase subunit alpha [Hyphomonadaceae bacterium]RZV41811.1 MAG: aromatic ring-hydroxylating dioxygenase subunit alpha [Acidimicrobiales bacterium]
MRDSAKPLKSATALDPKYYINSDTYHHEVNKMIPKGWQIVAPAQSVGGSGDVIARTLGDIPIIIVRSPSGALNGFYNICPHRAGPLAMCDKRGAKRLRCAYHGWAYDFDGQLKSAPEMNEAEDFDASAIQLTPINVKEWHGMIFAKAGDGLEFDTVIAEIDQIVGAQIDDMVYHSSIAYDVNANWKVYIDNYLEGYHLPFVHPSLTQAVDYSVYITELGKYWSLQRAPVDDETGAYESGEALYFFIYPNTMLNIMPGRLQTNRVVPTGINRCTVEFDFYYSPGVERRAPADIEFSEQVQEEDRLICEHVQKGLASGVYSPGRLSPARESGVWHWQNLLRADYLNADLL